MKKPRKKFPPGSPDEWLNHAMSDLILARIGADSAEVLPEQICLNEVRCQFYVAQDVGYITQNQFEHTSKLAEEVSRIIGELKTAVRNRNNT